MALLSLRSIRKDKAMPTYKRAEADGTYRMGKGQFLVKKGGRIPARATFVAKGVDIDSVPEETGEDQPSAVVDLESAPKWYQEKVAKAAKDGTEIPALLEGETQRAYEDRVATETPGTGDVDDAETHAAGEPSTEQPGPSETTEAAGPSETA